jgi:hypothetical protein
MCTFGEKCVFAHGADELSAWLATSHTAMME